MIIKLKERILYQKPRIIAKIKKQYDGVEDKYVFSVFKVVALYDKKVDFIFDYETANVHKQSSWLSSYSDARRK